MVSFVKGQNTEISFPIEIYINMNRKCCMITFLRNTTALPE